MSYYLIEVKVSKWLDVHWTSIIIENAALNRAENY